jgi:hypothetical protein
MYTFSPKGISGYLYKSVIDVKLSPKRWANSDEFNLVMQVNNNALTDNEVYKINPKKAIQWADIIFHPIKFTE